MDTTLGNPQGIIQTFEKALHSIVRYSIKVSKPNDESQLTEWKYDSPAALNVFWKSVKENIQDIIKYTQQCGTALEFHYKDIKLLLEAVIKHFL